MKLKRRRQMQSNPKKENTVQGDLSFNPGLTLFFHTGSSVWPFHGPHVFFTNYPNCRVLSSISEKPSNPTLQGVSKSS